MNITKLKGGSLSSTFLYKGESSFIRKEVNRTIDREYGYIRWYSQLKKLQRYGAIFPELFPKVLNVSYSENNAYFDIENLIGFTDIKTLLCEEELDEACIERMNHRLWASFDKVHAMSYLSATNMPSLYFKEEVEQKLADARRVHEFVQFCNYNEYIYNGNIVPGIDRHMSALQEFFNINLEKEEYIHGNPTLENIMYSIAEDRIIFIDLYEESIIDTKYLDYSQVLQCSRSHYGFINDRKILVDRNAVSHNLTIPKNFHIFNTHFVNELTNRQVNMRMVDILEATQFIRMLPFKCMAGELDKAKFFYVHACSLLSNIFDNDKKYIR